ncbi:MAG: biopolymer transporter ExbD [Gammaproteobacteria bacterium]|nr:biopolymer transporter ExbD [Gammaproteobacteria bacterium]MBU2058793.1 biopolymer transporter ExbD [Gammaproteobacteria bacterium]MBU2177144.1 biopolymer transporter ExbD [Gammaproteobacteria bacterium]MBU2247130.1 biopolymer transporter ExbD [Gammaproteobacteria bacterium]MBU2343622.1 biopolymer transporter ExbD [Gammaproteobacteria bacterium]
MAFGGGLDSDNEVMSEINMTPLVDVMLVLLIIFIITVPVITHSVKVDLPRVSNEQQEIKPQTLTLTVKADGAVFWDDQPIDAVQLQLKLADQAKLQPQPEVHIRGDKAAPYEHVLKTMAAVQQSGLLKLGFISEPAS